MSMMGVWKWDIKAGDDEAAVFTFKDLAYDATRTWKAQVRRYAGLNDTPEAECGVAVSADGTGRQVVAVSLTKVQTRSFADLKMQKAAWDLQVTESGGGVTTVLGGPVDIDLDVTR